MATFPASARAPRATYRATVRAYCLDLPASFRAIDPVPPACPEVTSVATVPLTPAAVPAAYPENRETVDGYCPVPQVGVFESRCSAA